MIALQLLFRITPENMCRKMQMQNIRTYFLVAIPVILIAAGRQLPTLDVR
jgi:hypothetical protein